MQKVAINKYAVKLQQICAGSLIGISLVFIQNFSGPDGASDLPAKIATIAFALALPFLAGILFLGIVHEKYQRGTPHSLVAKITYGCYLFGLVTAIAGVGAALWHISQIAGIAFMSALVVSTIIYGLYGLDLEEQPE